MSSLPAAREIAHGATGLELVRELLAEELGAVDRVIRKRLRSDVALVNQVAEHIITGGGKRLRPLTVLLGAGAFDQRGSETVELAAIVEFIHTATLLHDDVVDDSKLRRGRATANAVFGNEASVLVGDFVYSRAFQMMVSVGSVAVMEIMADTTNVIAEGEVLQLLNCHEPGTTEEQYLRVIRSKTAKLFEAAARLGTVLADAPQRQEQAMARYGMHLGTAYQLVDDVLDYRGATHEIGKNVGDDLAEGKPTLPLIHAMREGTGEQREVISAAIRGGGLDGIHAVLAAVESTGAIQYTSRVAQTEAERAMEALEEIPPSPYREGLEALVEFSVTRSY